MPGLDGGIGLLLYRRDGRVAEVNSTYASLVGYTREDILGRALWEFDSGVTPDFMESFWDSVPDGATRYYRAHHRCSDGSLVPVEMWITRVTIGGADYHACTLRELTGRREDHSPYKCYEQLISKMGGRTFILDSAGYYREVNDYLGTLSGYEPSEIIGSHPGLLHTDEEIERFERAIEQLLEDDDAGVKRIEAMLEKRDGDTIPIEVYLTLLPRVDGEFHGSMGVVRDISEEHDRQRELDRYKTILDTMPDPVIVTDLEGNHITVHGFEENFEYEKDEVEDASLDELTTEEGAEKALETMRELSECEEKKKATYEQIILTKDGREVPHENNMALLPPDDDGTTPGAVAVLRDITDHKKRERELEQYNNIIETVPDTVFVIDERGIIVGGNEHAAHMYGFSHNLEGESFLRLVDNGIYGEDVIDLYFDHIRELLSDETDKDHARFAYEVNIRGENRVMETHLALRPYDEEYRGTIGITRDITRRVERERELERYETMVEASGDPMYALDAQGRYIFTNEANLNLLGYQERDELLGTPASEVMDEGTAQRLREFTKNMLRNERRRGTLEMTYTTGDNEEIPVENHVALLVDDEDGFWASVNVVRDLSERKELEEKLRRQALYDELTGLPNRSLFMDRLQTHLSQFHEDPDERFAVLYMDLDRFKMVNDSLGHQMGDELLKGVAERLDETAEDSATVARLSGDEFAVLLEDSDAPGDALELADRLSRRLEEPFQLEDEKIFTTASLGVVTPEPGQYQDTEALLRDADIAMYRSKNSNERYTLFEPGMHRETEAEMKLEMQLQNALDNDELEVHYQPVLRVDDDVLLGFEALVRWNHPERGYLTPGEFLPLARKTGFMLQIDRWVLKQACRDLKRWREKHPDMDLSVSVNCSQVQFLDPAFVGLVENNLQTLDLDPGALYLEVAERTVVSNPDRASEIISTLQKKGVHIVLDDFGTGYSSLNYLSTLPIDVLKVDRAFVYKFEFDDQGGTSHRLVRVIMNMAESLDPSILADKVKAENIQSLLTLEGTDEGSTTDEGFHFARALQAYEVESMIDNG